MPSAGFAHNNIFDMIQSAYALRAIYVLTKLGVFDALAEGPKDLPAMCSQSSADEGILKDLLRMAVTLGFVRRHGSKYAIGKRALSLTVSSQSWLRAYLLVWGGSSIRQFHTWNRM